MPKGPQTPPPPTVPTAIRSREEAKLSDGVDTATFASGCFWGTEHIFNKYYGHLPQWKIEVGYTGGRDDATDPSYQQVCSGATKHAEAVRLHYQKGAVGYAELVEFFYRTHDPTTLNSQGPDMGTQYRSAIFYHTPEQLATAKAVTDEVQDKYFKGKQIVTEISPETKWWTAEEYHQQYLDNNPGGYECPTHRFYW
ncbi:hypothetical protein CspHIS471_0502380 [Cutaneotrichosporon sp. HIS471]|nr:hypothetical protein CspHIS471_0502380 [Cutaneotrichosporon sp. HIS471]